MAHDAVVGVSRHAQHAHVWTRRAEPLGQLRAAHLRHDDVGQEQVNRPGVLLADEERLAGDARLDDVVAILAQNAAGHDPDLIVVLDQQDGLAAPPRAGHHIGADGVECRIYAREVDLERGAPARLAVHPDAAAALLNDPKYRRQTEPRAFALPFGREERLEDA